MLKQIVVIFESAQTANQLDITSLLRNFNDKKNLFDLVLNGFKELGYNDNSVCVGPDQYTWHGRNPGHSAIATTPLLYKVSIHNYCIVEINKLHVLTFAELFDDKNIWSHTEILTLLNAIKDGSLKRYLYECNKMHLWVFIKLFVNMIYGYVNHPSSSLQLNREFDNDKFLAVRKNIVDDIIDRIGYKEDVAVIDVDTILYARNKADIVIDGIANARIDTDDYLDNTCVHLNYLCRKFKIDIVP